MFLRYTIILAMVLLVGCSKDHIKLQGDINASGELNPDANGRPSPVVLRVYQLRSAEVFSIKDFFTLYDKDKSVLGSDLIQRDEIELRPGASREYIKNEMSLETKYIGVIAAFRDIEHAVWRDLIKLPKDEYDVPLFIELNVNSVNLRIKE